MTFFKTEFPRLASSVPACLFFATLVQGQPDITVQPLDITVVEMQTASFRVQASGSGAIAYQWYRNGEPIDGADSVWYYAPPAQSDDDGAAYHVEVTDGEGTTVSDTAYVRISEYSARMELDRPDPASADYHIDAVNGSDSMGDGSAQAPFQTFNKVRPLLTGGELVVFHDGYYPEVRFTPSVIEEPFTDWVTLMAAPGTRPMIERLYIFGDEVIPRPSWNGGTDFRVRVIGFHIRDGAVIRESNYVRLEECLINRRGPYNETEADIEKSAVRIRSARSVTVQDCEITDTSHGITNRGNDLVIRRNKIHRIAHDGIRLSGCDVVLIEGNDIFNTDDGYTDAESPFPRHADGIQTFTEAPGAPTPIDLNNNITIRGNRIFHHESMAIMAEGSGSRNWVIENNVFGPTGGFMLHLKLAIHGFVFRHNTVVNVDNESYEGMFRTLPVSSYAVALPTYPVSSGVEIYNNIFRGPSVGHEFGIAAQHADRFENNLYHHRTHEFPDLGANAIVVETDPFVDPASYDGVLVPDSEAIKAGSAHDPIPFDIYGTPRGTPPDIGAYEHVERPDHEGWQEFSADGSGWADAGNWMGLLFTSHHPWIWSDMLNRWIYAPNETFHESGAWIYAP